MEIIAGSGCLYIGSGAVRLAAGTLCLGEGKEKFQSSLDELYKKLKENQNRYAPVTKIPYTGLTVPCKISGGTADIWDRNKLSGEKEFVDAGIMAKLQETALMAKDVMTERFHDILAGKFAFPDSLEDLGQIETEDYVAIVHIDGNNMGIRFGACTRICCSRHWCFILNGCRK